RSYLWPTHPRRRPRAPATKNRPGFCDRTAISTFLLDEVTYRGHAGRSRPAQNDKPTSLELSTTFREYFQTYRTMRWRAIHSRSLFSDFDVRLPRRKAASFAA